MTVEKAFEVLAGEKQKDLQLVQCFPFQQLLQLASVATSGVLERRIPSDRETAVIFHSSGTTGLPKPVFLAHRYLLGYAACHRLEPGQCLGKRNVSTLPMYHVRIRLACALCVQIVLTLILTRALAYLGHVSAWQLGKHAACRQRPSFRPPVQ